MHYCKGGAGTGVGLHLYCILLHPYISKIISNLCIIRLHYTVGMLLLGMENKATEKAETAKVVFFPMAAGWITGISDGEGIVNAKVSKTKRGAKAKAVEMAKETGLEIEEA